MPAEVNVRAAMLPELLENFGIASVPPIVVKGLTMDSRNVAEGYAYFALKGSASNGRNYIDQAVKERASVIVLDADDGAWQADKKLPIPVLPVSGLRCLLGRIAARFYGEPCRSACVIGVTGTNGKTSVSWFLSQALEGAGNKAALVGTLGYGSFEDLQTTGYTTPDAFELQRLCRELRGRGFNTICMEVSSHGLDQCRVSGAAFDAAVYTNLTRDHLDYHGDMDAYASAKATLFESDALKFVVLNRDDQYAERMRRGVKANVRVIEYGLEQGDVYVIRQLDSARGLHLKLMTPAGECEICTRLIGGFNIYNLLAVVATLVGLDIALTDIQTLAAELKPAPGRMEVFSGDESGPLIVVDYAHTPDALKQVLQAASEHTTGQIWCVFGCGGDRDRGKRPIMGETAEKFADQVIITDDNPRTENAASIVEQIVAGMTSSPKVIQDRRQAIEWAVSHAEPKDAVVIAGKGHETMQLVGDQRLHFSDREVVEELMGRAA